MNRFVWCDLSTFHLAECQAFYKQLFGWTYSEGDYTFAYQNNTPAAGLFIMPEFLQKINMPSFWMSYIAVDDLDQTVARARQHDNVIIEIEPTDFDSESQIALIRDPSGAGFTAYQGTSLNGRDELGRHGRMMWNIHHVENIETIREFYDDVFNWTIRPQQNIHEVVHQDGDVIAHIEVLDDSARGHKQYWMPIFVVDDLDVTCRTCQKIGGRVVASLESQRMLADSQGGHFLIQEAPEKHISMPVSTPAPKIRQGWKAGLGLVAVWIAVIYDLWWVWGLLFLFWLLPDLRRQETHFMERLTARDQPILYWLVMVSWGFLSLYLLSGLLMTEP